MKAIRFDMNHIKEFPFKKARRVKPEETEAFRKAIEKAQGNKRPKRAGRPPKTEEDKYKPVSIRLHPKVLAWAKREAKKRHIAYQTLINEILLKKAA